MRSQWACDVPCVATLVDKPPKGPGWAFEVKWEEYRLGVHFEPHGVRILTRRNYDWTKNVRQWAMHRSSWQGSPDMGSPQ